MCDEVIDSYDEDTDADGEAKSNEKAKSNDEAKSTKQILMKRK